VVVIGGGRVLADDTVAAVRGLAGIRRVSLSVPALPPLPEVVRVEQSDGRTHLLTTDADGLVRELVHKGVEFHDLEIRPTSLEEAFLTLTAADGGRS
jgi:ABC-2 type transport system ATP-binding protein